MHRTHFQRSSLTLSLLLAGAFAAGCGGSGSRSSSSTAGVSSGTPSSTTSGTTGTTTSGATFFDPQGQVGSITTATTTVQATLATDAYIAFRELQSLSDFVIPEDPALTDKAFVVEDKGTLRILDLSGAAPALDRAVDLFAAPLPAGIATGRLKIQSANLGLVTTSGAGGEGVVVFNPLTAMGPTDVTWFDFSASTVQWPAGTLNNKGVDVGAQALMLSYTADAVVSGGKLLLTASNLDANFDYNPGAVVAYDFDPLTNTLSGGAFIQTSDFNPTALTRVMTPQGELVLVTNTGPYGGPDGSIDVVDPMTLTRLGTIGFPAGSSPTGNVVVSKDGKRAYLGSQSSAQVFVLDLDGLETSFGQLNADLSARFKGGFALGGTAANHFVSSLALSYSERYLYAVDLNESALYVIDLQEGTSAATVEGFVRSGLRANYEGLANKVVVRPGEPGVDFSGPSLFVMTTGLAVADRTLTDVTMALDTVTVDKH
ncbi:MAG: hypothetical protein JKY65_27265 [Planctomycetes bacterium]|nr:hypothetical protein [Planctomycetota bacterium]